MLIERGKMQVVVKKFEELSNYELYDILRLRSSVFVVEQNCVYLDADSIDLNAYHVYLKDGETIVAYLRVIDKGLRMEEVSIGRVISLKRRKGFGTKVMLEGIRVAKEKFGAKKIKIGAQEYAVPFYESVGFKVLPNGNYIEDGQPHVYMLYEE